MKAGGRNLPPTVSYPAGNLVTDSTAWRKKVPILKADLCSGCRLCFALCPEGAVEAQADGRPHFEERWCKACGICLAECPKKALGWRPA